MLLRFLRPVSISFSLFAAFAIVFAGCSDLAAPVDVGSTAELAWQNQTLQDPEPIELADLDIEGAYLQGLHADAAKPSGGFRRLINFVESLDEEFEYTNRKWLVKTQKIDSDGGVITFGTQDVGYSTMEFPEGAVDEKTHIKIIMKLRGKRDLFLFPEGVVFNEPVTLKFSLEGLSSRAIKRIMSLRLFYHNPDPDGDPDTDDGGWEYIDSSCDGVYVTATLEHFSRYAVGGDE
jgi:hypothetical protein